MRRIALTAAVALALVGAWTTTAVAQQDQPPPPSCTAATFRAFSGHVWDIDRWQRGAPKATTIAAQRRRLECAPPGHRAAMQHRWRTDKRAFYAEVHRCNSGTVVAGRVSFFDGPASTTASGQPVSRSGIALNIAPGTDAGWNNPTTRSWVATLQRFEVTIAGHTTILPVTDLGPSGFTGRAIDVTAAGVHALGLSTAAFPTDSQGTAKLIPPRC
jgi:hypothetical protein